MFVDASVSTKDATPNGAGPTVFENAVATMHAARISKTFFMAQVYHSSRALVNPAQIWARFHTSPKFF